MISLAGLAASAITSIAIPAAPASASSALQFTSGYCQVDEVGDPYNYAECHFTWTGGTEPITVWVGGSNSEEIYETDVQPGSAIVYLGCTPGSMVYARIFLTDATGATAGGDAARHCYMAA